MLTAPPPSASFMDEGCATEEPDEDGGAFSSSDMHLLFERGKETHVLALYRLATLFFSDVVDFTVHDEAVYLNASQLLTNVACFPEARVQDGLRYLRSHRSSLALIVTQGEEVLVDLSIGAMIAASCETKRASLFKDKLVAFVVNDLYGEQRDEAFERWRNLLDASVYSALMVAYVKPALCEACEEKLRLFN